MRKFINNVILFLLSVVVLFCFVCVLIDPFGVFHPLSIQDNGVDKNKNYIKMTYLLKNPGKFDSFVFGSSRVGNIHTDKIEEENCYNMTMSVATPMDHLLNIQTLLSEGIVPKHIYIGVDTISYTEDYSSHEHRESNAPYEKSILSPTSFWRMYLVPSTSGKALLSVIIPHFVDVLAGVPSPCDDYQKVFYEYGWIYDYGYVPTDSIFGHAENAQFTKQLIADRFSSEDADSTVDYGYLDDTIEALHSISLLCEENGIQLTVFTIPNYYTYLPDMMLEQHYAAFLYRLAEVVPSFYNFSGYNDVTIDSNNYVDVSHFNAEVGDLLIDCMCSRSVPENLAKQGFGMEVNKDNVNELISLLTSSELIRSDTKTG